MFLNFALEIGWELNCLSLNNMILIWLNPNTLAYASDFPLIMPLCLSNNAFDV